MSENVAESGEAGGSPPTIPAGWRLRAEMFRRGVTERDLATAAGVAQSTVNRAVRGGRAKLETWIQLRTAVESFPINPEANKLLLDGYVAEFPRDQVRRLIAGAAS